MGCITALRPLVKGDTDDLLGNAPVLGTFADYHADVRPCACAGRRRVGARWRECRTMASGFARAEKLKSETKAHADLQAGVCCSAPRERSGTEPRPESRIELHLAALEGDQRQGRRADMELLRVGRGADARGQGRPSKRRSRSFGTFLPMRSARCAQPFRCRQRALSRSSATRSHPTRPAGIRSDTPGRRNLRPRRSNTSGSRRSGKRSGCRRSRFFRPRSRHSCPARS